MKYVNLRKKYELISYYIKKNKIAKEIKLPIMSNVRHRQTLNKQNARIHEKMFRQFHIHQQIIVNYLVTICMLKICNAVYHISNPV